MNYQGFEREFEEASQVLEEDGVKKETISEPQAALMLFELGFINEKSNEDVEMAAELLGYIKHEEEEKEPEIRVQDLKVILTAVMNF